MTANGTPKALMELVESMKREHEFLVSKARIQDESGMDSSCTHAKAQIFHGHARALLALLREWDVTLAAFVRSPEAKWVREKMLGVEHEK